MKKIIKIELRELVTSPFLYGVAVFLFACTNVFPIVVGSYTSIDSILADICKNIVGPLIASGTYIGLSHSVDFKKGLVRLYISSGIKRGQIIFAKYIHSIVASLIILLMDIFSSSLLLSIVQRRVLLDDLLKCFKMMICIFPFWITLIAIFQMITEISQSAVISVSLSFAMVFIFTAITNIFRESPIIRIFPLYSIISVGHISETDWLGKSYYIALFVSLLILTLVYAVTYIYAKHKQY